jgi:CRP/FNR family transcriptional regulator, transcriptional activator FtrB
MRTTDIEQIRSAHLFREMGEEHFAELVKAAYLQRFPAQVSLIAEHEKPDFLHVVMEGGVELYSRHGRRETTIAICRPFTTFILAAVVRDLPYLASGRTIEPSRVLMLPVEDVRSAFDRDGAFARAIVRELSSSFRGVMKELKSHKLRTGAERLANWILVNDRRNGGDGRFTLPYDKRTLAAQLGMTPENLSRNLAQIAGHGVTIKNRDVVVDDAAKLTDFANPTPSIDDDDY